MPTDLTRQVYNHPMHHDPVDLRSDTVTQPTQEMLDAMMQSALGDDVWGDVPTVNALQKRCAELFGKEDASFVPSGTMANQVSIRSQTQPGDEIIVHEESHIVRYEAGGAAALSGCSFATARGDNGIFEAQDVRDLIRSDDAHLGRSRLVALENTHNRGGGTIWPLQQLIDVCETAKHYGLRTHLDGARIWNAVVASGVEPAVWAKPFDTVAVCFSKGLGCPAGSLVLGDEETIHKVRRFRKMYGGVMRQTGILAGAAMYALDHNIERLSEDHANAKYLATELNRIDGGSCNIETTQTNLVFFDLDNHYGDGNSFCRRLSEHGVLAEALDSQCVRFVTHLGVTKGDIDRTIEVVVDLCQDLSTN